MMSQVFHIAMAAALFIATAASSSAATIELITNGDFESGTFAGWTLGSNAAQNAWVINDGTVNRTGGQGSVMPISGEFDALTQMCCVGFETMFQTVTVPIGTFVATLSWDDRIWNAGSYFQDPEQEFRVELRTVTDGLITPVFSTNPGDPLIQPGPNSRSFDVTAALLPYQGQQLRVSFTTQQHFWHFNNSVDNVSLTATATVPEPASLTFFGTGLIGLLVVGRRREFLFMSAAASRRMRKSPLHKS
jgi:hypothetical protein